MLLCATSAAEPERRECNGNEVEKERAPVTAKSELVNMLEEHELGVHLPVMASSV